MPRIILIAFEKVFGTDWHYGDSLNDEARENMEFFQSFFILELQVRYGIKNGQRKHLNSQASLAMFKGANMCHC